MVKMRTPTWLKGLVKGTGTSEEKRSSVASGVDQSPANRKVDEAKCACTTLLQFSCGSQASPLFRPLGGSWSVIYEALARHPEPVPPAASAALRAAAEFVQGAKSRELRLQFALLVHTDEAALSRFVGDVEGAIVLLCKAASNSDPLLSEEGLLGQWRSDIEAFRRRCREIWELYMYFVFLDVKGDRALLRMVSRQLLNLLEVTPSGLVANLSHTGPWAQPALQILAKGMGASLLERRHRQALEEWHSAVQAATAKACESAAGAKGEPNKEAIKAELHRQQALQFWSHYFQTSAKVGWWDFADAFQECFCGNSCPADVLSRLQRHVAKSRTSVQLHAWETFLEKHGPSAPRLLSALVNEVMGDLPLSVYRAARSAPESTCEEAEVLRFFARSASRQLKGLSLPDGNLDFRPAEREPKNPSLRQAAQAAKAPEDLKQAFPTPSSGPPGVYTVPCRRSEAEGRQIESAATPQDPRMQMGPSEPGEAISWDDFEAQLHASSRPWWLGPQLEHRSVTEEPLYAQAIRRVQSGLTATRKALVLRVCSGTLGAGRPRLGGQQPAIVITPNDTDCALTTKFGRGRTEGSGTLQPHVLMTEPIASRSHFSVIYNEEKEKFQVMDTGSKWGTFKKVTKSGQPVSCGDWIRVGNAELIVRFCGGGCNSHRRHAHHRLHALGVAAVCGGGFRNRVNFEAPLRAPSFRVEEQVDSDDDTHQVSDKVVDILAKTRLNGAVQKNWSSSFERLCREVNPSGEGALRPGGFQARPSGVSLEATPLEIDFISGPRIGERMMLTNRLCTIGRGENCTVQLSDASLANVSRVHCSFRSCGGRWWLCDEGSTNGTWRRLSCALEPSEPCDINSGETLLAGVQELQVEEAELKRWWIPSPGTSVLSELCKSDR